MKSFGIPDDIHQYVDAHTNPVSDPFGDQLAASTQERFPRQAVMNIGDDQGRFMKMLAEVMSAKTIVEVGTFTGMSALWLAQGLSDDGQMLCFDVTDTYLETATKAWEAAGVADRIDFRLGRAVDGLAELPSEPHIDLAFIDADKVSYRQYLDLLLPRMTDRGVILVDNVLWGGAVVDDEDASADTVALRDFNRHVSERDDCDAVILTIGDGLTMIRPRR